MLPEEDQAMATGIMQKNLVKIGHTVFELCEQTDRHIDRHTHYNTSYRYRVNVVILNAIPNILLHTKSLDRQFFVCGMKWLLVFSFNAFIFLAFAHKNISVSDLNWQVTLVSLNGLTRALTLRERCTNNMHFPVIQYCHKVVLPVILLRQVPCCTE